MSAKVRLLFVGYADSVHLARWTSQLDGLGWDLQVFAVTDHPPHGQLRNVTVHRLMRSLWRGTHGRQAGIPWPLPRGETRMTSLLRRLDRFSRPARLAKLIERLKPNIVHSAEMQQAAYLTLEARKRVKHAFPPWIYTCWGNDLYRFAKLPGHVQRIRDVLQSCDYVFTDCERDVHLARHYGFAGKVLGVYPGGGGYELSKNRRQRAPGRPSCRRVIAVKGYEGGIQDGRGTIALKALRQCRPLLAGYEIVIYSAAPEVRAEAVLLSSAGIRVTIVPTFVDHAEMMRLFGRSRIALALSMSDGSPNTMLEAMIMGAFPVQSDTISTREWINGANGLLVPAEDVGQVAEALRAALTDGELVDRADALNWHIADKRLERDRIRDEVIQIYHSVVTGTVEQETSLCHATASAAVE